MGLNNGTGQIFVGNPGANVGSNGLRRSPRPEGGAIEQGVDDWAFGLPELPISFPMVSFSLLGLLYSEPNGSRRATPPSTFQQKPGHSHK